MGVLMAQKGIARVGDSCSGTCTAHRRTTAWTGPLLTSSVGFTVDGIGACGVGDTGNTSCGHHFRVTSGSSVLTGNGIIVARQGDSVIVIEGGSGVVDVGSSVVTSE